MDEKFMQLAIEEAWKGHGFVSPNPKVGAVLVKDGVVVASGYHTEFGDIHAEVACLSNYEKKLTGDETLYVTLEPCDHHGKQPPCVDSLLKRNVKRVIIGMEDVGSRGVSILRNAGVDVLVGVLEAECREMNKGFLKLGQVKHPYVIMKVGMTAMGQIAPLPRQRWQITGPESKDRVYQLRSRVDAILVGKNTVLVDDPELAARCKNGFEPLRVGLGRLVESDLIGKQFVRDDNYLIVSGDTILSVLKQLAEAGVTSVLVEGGAKVFTSFLEANLVDELSMTVNESHASFKRGLSAFRDLPVAIRELDGWSFVTEAVGGDRWYKFIK